MKNEIDDGGRAFPSAGFKGMTRRDWLAGMALQGLCAAPIPSGQWTALAEIYGCKLEEAPVLQSYVLADAMIRIGKLPK
jgi:hypothetical protein